MTIFQFGDQFTLVSFTSFTEHLQCIILCDALTYECLFLSSQFSHFLFNGRQVTFLDHGFSRIYIIIESVFNSRSDTKLNTRVKLLQSLSQQVSTCMPEGMLTFFIFPFIKNEVCIFADRTIQINRFTVHATCQDVLSQTRTDAFCNLQTSNSFVIFTNRAIRKSYFNHKFMYLSINEWQK